ncbi:hypothetical protein AB1K77_004217 [Citrobacter sedlakii]
MSFYLMREGEKDPIPTIFRSIWSDSEFIVTVSRVAVFFINFLKSRLLLVFCVYLFSGVDIRKTEMPTTLDSLQAVVDKFDEKIKVFVEAEGIRLEVEDVKLQSGLHGKNYTFQLRDDLPPYGLKFDDAQGIISYITHFEGEVMGECQAIFNGHKRLVIHPSSPDELTIEAEPDVWFFISHETEIDRFNGFLASAKEHARLFY